MIYILYILLCFNPSHASRACLPHEQKLNSRCTVFKINVSAKKKTRREKGARLSSLPYQWKGQRREGFTHKSGDTHSFCKQHWYRQQINIVFGQQWIKWCMDSTKLTVPNCKDLRKSLGEFKKKKKLCISVSCICHTQTAWAYTRVLYIRF